MKVNFGMMVLVITSLFMSLNSPSVSYGADWLGCGTRGCSSQSYVNQGVQPPPEVFPVDKLGMALNCNIWSMDQAALDDCSKDLDLIAGLGIGSVKIGLAWYMMTEPDGSISPDKVIFLNSLLNAARIRGMKILFLINLPAPVSAYQCAETQEPPTEASTRLDFCNDAFVRFFDELMDIVLPFTAHIELFNETNWGYPTTAPAYVTYGPESYILSRSKALYIYAKQILDAKKQLGYQAILHSQGISYFFNSSYPSRGWYATPLIEATTYLYWMEYGWQGEENVLNSVIDVVDLHPYFNSTDYSLMIYDIMTRLADMVPGRYKYVWVTETNGVSGDENDQIAVFNKLKWYLDNNWIQKAYWYVIRSGYGDSLSDEYGIYDVNRNLVRPELANTMRVEAEKIPCSQRFLSEVYRQPINYSNNSSDLVQTPVSHTCD